MTYVDAKPVAEHLQHLIDAGRSQLSIQAETGVNRETLRNLTRRRWCHSRTADALMAVSIPDAEVAHIASAPELYDGRWVVRRGVFRWEIAA